MVPTVLCPDTWAMIAGVPTREAADGHKTNHAVVVTVSLCFSLLFIHGKMLPGSETPPITLLLIMAM